MNFYFLESSFFLIFCLFLVVASITSPPVAIPPSPVLSRPSKPPGIAPPTTRLSLTRTSQSRISYESDADLSGPNALSQEPPLLPPKPLSQLPMKPLSAPPNKPPSGPPTKLPSAPPSKPPSGPPSKQPSIPPTTLLAEVDQSDSGLVERNSTINRLFTNVLAADNDEIAIVNAQPSLGPSIPPRKTGLIKKEAQSLFGSSNIRHFVLTTTFIKNGFYESTLKWYAKGLSSFPYGENEKGSIILKNATVYSTGYTIIVRDAVNEELKLQFTKDQIEEKNEWFRTISEHIEFVNSYSNE